MTFLSVNIDHIATIREARRTNEPDPVTAAAICELAGAHGITVHLRGDRRHIQHRDVKTLRETVKTKLNIEMAATTEMIGIAWRNHDDRRIGLHAQSRGDYERDQASTIEQYQRQLIHRSGRIADPSRAFARRAHD